MADKKLVKYIREQIKKGYDTKTIREYLLRYGYSSSDVNEGINSIYSPEVKHVIHFSPTTLIGIAVIFIGIISAVFLFLNFSQKAPDQLLDLNLEPIKTEVNAGEDIIFLTEITNMGSGVRYDINIKYEVIYLKTNEVLTFKEETRGIETIGSKQSKISISSDADAGKYVLRAIAAYNGQRAVATLPVTIAKKEGLEYPVEEEKEEPEEEEEIIEEPEEIPEEEIEEDEKETETIGRSALTTFETIEKVEEIANNNPQEAESLCNKLELRTSKDLCFNKLGEVLGDIKYCEKIADERTKDICLSNVAIFLKNTEICNGIAKDSRKDSCYMNFVIDNKDYTVCDKVINQYLKQSCESLRQLSELNISDVAFYETLLNQSLIEFV